MKTLNIKTKKLESLKSFAINKQQSIKTDGGQTLPYQPLTPSYLTEPGYTSMVGSGGCTGAHDPKTGAGTTTCGNVTLD